MDSGNLAGYLLVLKSGLIGIIDSELSIQAYLSGLEVTLSFLADISPNSADSKLTIHIEELQRTISTALQADAPSLSEFKGFLTQFASQVAMIRQTVGRDSQEEALARWVDALDIQCKAIMNDLMILAPWIEHLASSDKPCLFLELDMIFSLQQVLELPMQMKPQIDTELAANPNAANRAWLDQLQVHLETASQNAGIWIRFIEHTASQCEALSDMDLDFLYDKKRNLLSIGYLVSEHRQDNSFYDLLASEARLSNFVGIAQGKLPQKTWFYLGRLLTTAVGQPILLSWSGSMFEYLMPLLVMPNYDNTLLDQTYRAVVARQIEYGGKRSTPWGISESGYNAIDVHQNYQYRAFGVPGLGLKRGLAEDLVVAPYASALALMVAPEEACSNLELLATEGFEGPYGMYEAIDYTPSRLPRKQTHAVVSSFMAHHQGMTLLSLAYLLLDRPMQKRFEADTRFQATLLLLQERIPVATAHHALTTNLAEHYQTSNSQETPFRVYTDPDTQYPEVQLLSNGRYHIMLTNAGGGYSKWKNLAVTRWHEDRTCDKWGTFCYLRDMASKEFWSIAPQPVRKRSQFFEAVFSEGRVEYRGRNNNFDTHTEIAVSPEDDIELRRVSITNRGKNRRIVEITSYAEVCLAPPAADALHPAFSKLFVQTEILEHSHAILATRRPRSPEEHEPWLLHLISVHETGINGVSYETDRLKFIGRGNTASNPRALAAETNFGNTDLSNTAGSVLDPIFAIRCRIELDPDKTVTLNMVTGIGETRAEALSLIEKYQDRHLVDRVFNLAWTHGRMLLRQFNISEGDAQLYNRLASSIIYTNASLRTDSSVLVKNTRGQSGLWGYAISGDYPIVLLQIEDTDNIDLVRQLIQAHTYWRFKGLIVDLVIWNEDHAGYRQLLHDQITGLINASSDTSQADQPGKIFLRAGDQISEEDRILIKSVARIIIKDSRGSLAEQIQGRRIAEINVPQLKTTRSIKPEAQPILPLPRTDLRFFNGTGGFTPDGREYVITTTREQLTPAPWVNVLANAQFGTVVSESGLAYTWGENSHEFRLSPWTNDPISDSRGEAFYLRDEERGNFWSPAPEPSKGPAPYVTRHGFGYSVFEHTQNGIQSELWIYVALNAPIKFAVLKVRNTLERARKLSATGYLEWVLGDLRQKTAMHVITELDPLSGAILAHNNYNNDFPDRVAFFDVDAANRSSTCDRTEFLGRNGSLSSPAAMFRSRLSGKSGAALDPCAALQVSFELAPGEEQEFTFRIGLGRNLEEARALIKRFRGQMAAKDELDAVWHDWSHTLGTVNVETPDQVLNMLANGWLLYQVLSCRFWARTATYQSGGAIGFRDQLQDSLALIHAQPTLVREHLLLCAAHQYPEGDVQHWWHPPMDSGVRTRCSDDYLWLPFVVSHYVAATGDTGILDVPEHFVIGRLVNTNEDSYYQVPGRSKETATLYQHCVLAILNGLKTGIHGLPLMGTGDWNDGMNMVGEDGKGESVWLGFFLYDVLIRFAELARNHGDTVFAAQCLQESEKLRENLDKHAWDGEWYRRAYFDDGTPLGSSANVECKIDSISQSWSVLSGAGNAKRSRLAMDAVDKYLVRRDHGLVLLFDPPFDKSPLNPGYIKGYVPGVRENGGQYTHAAIWAAMAFAKLGDPQRAWELFSLINPVNHARSAGENSVYKVEPYVMAADVYAVSPHTGRGGWTWYTGSAALMYNLIIESLLGLKLEVDRLRIQPCLPPEWPGFKLHYRYRETVYHIEVIQISTEGGEMSLTLDGQEQKDDSIRLIDDHLEHWVNIKIYPCHVAKT